MQHTTAQPTTTPAPVLAAGRYSWQRPGVLLNVTVSGCGAVVADIYTGIGALPLDPVAAYAELLRTLAEQHPVSFTPAPAPVHITRARARALHKQLASVWNNEERYEQAARIAGRPVESLTALTEEEARALLVAAAAEQTARDNAQEAAQTDPRYIGTDEERAAAWLR